MLFEQNVDMKKAPKINTLKTLLWLSCPTILSNIEERIISNSVTYIWEFVMMNKIVVQPISTQLADMVTKASSVLKELQQKMGI